MIYFIQAGADGPIKVGFTNGSIYRRMANLKSANPSDLILLGVIRDGDEKDEAALHARFADASVRGEWFEPREELLALIRDETEASDVLPCEFGDDGSALFMRTNLEYPIPLRDRIDAQASIDRRSRKDEILVLLEEALDRREKRK